MPWTTQNYPAAMKNLPTDVRNKAIEIANAIVDEDAMEEGLAIATGISRAKDWAANRGKLVEQANTAGRVKTKTDVKQHGEDRYVIPATDGWAVKQEKGPQKGYPTKAAAVAAARSEAKAANASLTIQGKTGKIQRRISYNPNKQT